MATVLGECTRKARAACGLVRFAALSDDEGDDEGGNDELGMVGSGGNDRLSK